MKRFQRATLSILLFFFCMMLHAQTAIQGNVVDNTGEPVIGATVMEKGTKNAAITDLDGNPKIRKKSR